MHRLVASSVVVLGVLLLVSCPGPNPFGPGDFADQFRHELDFMKGKATQPDSTILADEMDLVMFQVKLKVMSPSEPVRIDSLSFRAVGTADEVEDIIWADLYLDKNRNGIADASQDTLLRGSKTFNRNDGKVRFGNLNLVIDHGKSAMLLLVLDLAGTASEGETFQVRLADEDDVEAEGDDSGCPVDVDGIPVLSPERTVDIETTGVVVVSPGDFMPPAREVGPTDKDVEMLQIAVETTGGATALVDSITFYGQGTADEANDLNNVRLYRDVDGNGALDTLVDILLGTGEYTQDDGTVTFTALTEMISPTDLRHYLLVYDLLGPHPGETLLAGIGSPADVSASEAFDSTPLNVVGPPIEGEPISIEFGNA